MQNALPIRREHIFLLLAVIAVGAFTGLTGARVILAVTA